jgi:hypothetical protein
MARFSLTELMFGHHGIAYISDTSLSDRASILAKVTRKLFEQGYELFGSEDALDDKALEQAIEQAKAEVCGVFGSGDIGHGGNSAIDEAKLYH